MTLDLDEISLELRFMYPEPSLFSSLTNITVLRPEVSSVSAIMAADGIIVPTIADKFSLSGLQEVYTSAKAIKPQLALVGVIVTQFDNTNIDKAVLEALQQQAKIYHSAVIMPPIRRTTNARRWHYTGEIYKGRSTAGKDYAEVVNQIPKLIKLKKRR